MEGNGMRVLVVSDIHGNLAALQAVVEDAQQFNFQTVWCLGDTVGYGPEPNECVELVRQLASICVIGNHDWAVLGGMDIEDFNAEARKAVLWTRNQLSADNLAWLRSLPNSPVTYGDFTLTHGSPRDPVWEYILYPSTARANFDYFRTTYCMVGHTHVPALYFWYQNDTNVRALMPTVGQIVELQKPRGDPVPQLRMIINPGSVGQPRDNDPRSAYGIVDTDRGTWISGRAAYPFEITQAHMRQAGLPDRLITRLAYGW
jgi:predicted phosphodiesterase